MKGQKIPEFKHVMERRSKIKKKFSKRVTFFREVIKTTEKAAGNFSLKKDKRKHGKLFTLKLPNTLDFIQEIKTAMGEYAKRL